MLVDNNDDDGIDDGIDDDDNDEDELTPLFPSTDNWVICCGTPAVRLGPAASTSPTAANEVDTVERAESATVGRTGSCSAASCSRAWAPRISSARASRRRGTARRSR